MATTLLTHLRSVYSLETLDTRFVSSSSTPYASRSAPLPHGKPTTPVQSIDPAEKNGPVPVIGGGGGAGMSSADAVGRTVGEKVIDGKPLRGSDALSIGNRGIDHRRADKGDRANGTTTTATEIKISTPAASSASTTRPAAKPSRWNTTEFHVYYLVFLICVPLMFWVPYTVSRPSDPRYNKYEHLLSDGWIPGRKIDVSDAQYQTFREGLPSFGILMILHPLLRRVYDALWSNDPRSPTKTSTGGSASHAHVANVAAGTARLNRRASFDFGFAIFLLALLHGFSMFKVFAILYANYCIAMRLPRTYIPVATWIFNVGILFANELAHGYHFVSIVEFFLGSSDGAGSLLHSAAQWLDSYGGLISRWEILFNITVLRLISYNLDYYWSLGNLSGSPVEKKQLDVANLSERDRIKQSAPQSAFTFRNYVAYALYAPVYLTGPILTFNDYISQLSYPPASIRPALTFRYAIRFLLCLLTMELVLHTVYPVAISHASPDWSSYTPAQLCLLSYFNLHIIWLKLLLPWRMARLWALIDGVDAPENMLRCMSNNPSTQGFWRAWHRSFNRWLTRYIYVPLGGASARGGWAVARTVRNYALVFTFVALWHDISLNLLIWGWLIIFFMLPEVAAAAAFPRRRWEPARPTLYRALRGLGAVANICMMLAANLVGFAVGLDGLRSIVAGVLADWAGVAFVLTAMAALFVGSQVMFELREAEARRGVWLKC